MHNGRGFRRVIPPDPNLDMQPHNCAPVRMYLEGTFNYGGGYIFFPGVSGYSGPCTFTYATGQYLYSGSFGTLLSNFYWAFFQQLHVGGRFLDWQLTLLDDFGSVQIRDWVNQDHSASGWGTFPGDWLSTPTAEFNSGFFQPGGDLRTLPLRYHDEP